MVESIEKFLTQDQLLDMMKDVGMKECSYENLTDGIVAIHSGFKLWNFYYKYLFFGKKTKK